VSHGRLRHLGHRDAHRLHANRRAPPGIDDGRPVQALPALSVAVTFNQPSTFRAGWGCWANGRAYQKATEASRKSKRECHHEKPNAARALRSAAVYGKCTSRISKFGRQRTAAEPWPQPAPAARRPIYMIADPCLAPISSS
jgi:hypothetical protein